MLLSYGRLQKLEPKIDALVVLAPRSLETMHVQLVPQHAKQAKEFLAKHAPLAKQLIAEAMIAKGDADAARIGTLKKLLAKYDTGKQVGASSVHAVSTESYDEWDGGRKYRVVKKKFTSYYVWKPKQPEANTPAIDGVKPEEVCELWRQNLIRYDSGGPKHAPLEEWRLEQAAFVSPMLCANKDKRSARPYKP